jgi:hypothetical protein
MEPFEQIRRDRNREGLSTRGWRSSTAFIGTLAPQRAEVVAA